MEWAWEVLKHRYFDLHSPYSGRSDCENAQKGQDLAKVFRVWRTKMAKWEVLEVQKHLPWTPFGLPEASTTMVVRPYGSPDRNADPELP